MTVSSRGFGLSAIAHAAISVALLAAVLGAVFALSGPDALADALAQVKPSSILLIAVLLTAGVGLSSLRLKMIASNLGYTLSLRDAVMALTIGQIAGSLFFQFFGQLIGRTAVLAGRGIPPAASVVLFGYERIFALLVSLGLATGGAVYLFGTLHFDLRGGGISLLQIMVGIAVAVIAGAALAWGRQAQQLWQSLTPLLSSRMGWSGLLSLAVQLTTLAAYMVAGYTLAPNVELASLAAASCVIMFASSLPISFAGWGLREMSAVVVLQAIGFSNTTALVAGLLIGVVSLIVLASSALVFQFIVRPTQVVLQPVETSNTPDYTLALDWILPIAAATAVFFQVYIPTGSGDLNVNLADPVVLIGFALYVLRHIPKGWPEWRVPGLLICLVATTLVIVFAFLHGLFTFGFTSWAFANRFLGWGMLLCYAATGALIVERAHAEGYEVLIKTFAATAVAISLLNTGLLALRLLSSDSANITDTRIAGFSQNPNAFAFTLLMALAAVLALRRNGWLRTTMLTCILVGLWYTGSRSGIGAGVIVIALALWWGISWRPVLLALLVAAITIILIKLLPAIAGNVLNSNLIIAMPWHERASSDREHVDSLWLGLTMIPAHPIFGAGLGAFIEERLRQTGIPLIIHSTPVWLLVETGIVGFLVFLAAAWQIARTELARRTDPVALMILLMLCALAIMSSIHELLYQRAFWLLLGTALAYPFVATESAAQPSAAPPKG